MANQPLPKMPPRQLTAKDDPNIKIGPTFADELKVAGLLGAPFAWAINGEFFGRENLTPEQNATLDKVYAAHDPTKETFMAPTLDMGGTTAEILGD
jgi:hypothetical protein